MQNLKELAHQMLEIAKGNLLQDGLLTPVALVVTPDENLICGIPFANEEEKGEAYKRLVEEARKANALAIITVNDSHYRPPAGDLKKYKDGYYYGRLAAEGAPECILVTVSGPAIPNWSVFAYYERRGQEIVFLATEEEEGPEINFLPGWPQGGSSPS